ncbi:hypothetical protein Peur_029601 [Populus x canadensis]
MGIMDETHNLKVLGSGKQVIVVLSHDFGTDQLVWKYLVSHLVNIYCVLQSLVLRVSSASGRWHGLGGGARIQSNLVLALHPSNSQAYLL